MKETRCSFSADRFARLLLATNPAELNMHSAATGTEETDEERGQVQLSHLVAWPKVCRLFCGGYWISEIRRD